MNLRIPTNLNSLSRSRAHHDTHIRAETRNAGSVSIYKRDSAEVRSRNDSLPDYPTFYKKSLEQLKNHPRFAFMSHMLSGRNDGQQVMDKHMADMYYKLSGHHPDGAVWAQPGRSQALHDDALRTIGLDPNKTYTKDQVRDARNRAVDQLNGTRFSNMSRAQQMEEGLYGKPDALNSACLVLDSYYDLKS